MSSSMVVSKRSRPGEAGRAGGLIAENARRDRGRREPAKLAVLSMDEDAPIPLDQPRDESPGARFVGFGGQPGDDACG